MKPEVEAALALLQDAVNYLEELGPRHAKSLVVIRRALLDASVDRTAREFLAADLVALAEGKPVKTNLAAAVEHKIEKLSSREFPILQPPKGGLRSIPWRMIAPQEAQAISNHSQTLERLATRGGLSATEAVAVLRGVCWSALRGMSGETANAELVRLVEEFARV